MDVVVILVDVSNGCSKKVLQTSVLLDVVAEYVEVYTCTNKVLVGIYTCSYVPGTSIYTSSGLPSMHRHSKRPV